MQVIADLHTHTLVSGHAYSTLQENLQAAAAHGLLYLATTEHGPAMPGAPRLSYFSNFRALPESIAGVRLLKGVEANILGVDGSLDVPERHLKRLEYVAVGLHADCLAPASVEDNTRAVLAALQNPWVNTLVHPGNPLFPLDLPRVVQAAAAWSVLLEVNNSSLLGSRKGSQPGCLEIAKLAKANHCRVVLGSDAHWSGDVGRLDLAMELVEQAGVPESAIINLHPEQIDALLEENVRARQQGPRLRLLR